MVVTEKPLEAPVPPLVAGQQDREMLPQQPAEPTEKSDATSVKPKDIEQPASESVFHSLTIYFRCLFAADPTWLDITLIVGGSICAAAAGTPLLLLDESTSALDAASEAALQEGLERASRGTTVLAITHRLHTVQKADVILIVEGGKIVDQGRHTELMERRESYRINAMQQMLQ
ncbi:hypothetical protein BN1723_018957 [Verticillium longisporum]|uniref:ABC transporter domain-containing protein n=1 Tax=Verticillium longisporum TaxID=100787 RepID=A0A0G4N6B4_VERLO|nr:hypothetical protein BN1723_018957 [Verticillium longisporum]